jgi:hypothetical protein
MLVAGCAADAADGAAASSDAGAEVDELNATSLRAATAMKGTVVAGSSITIAYDRAESFYPRAVPYLAVEIVAPPEPAHGGATGGIHPMNGELGSAQSITVQGEFPGRPKVLVVDENFRQLTSSVAKTLPDGTERADFAAPRSGSKRFVLVRDGRWSKPMEFQIGVGL